jgi:hypothetical protein
MDPDANWEETKMLQDKRARGEADEDDLERLADLSEALLSWISNGGFRPRDWEPEGERP